MHTYAHTRHTSTHILYHTHQEKHSVIAHRRSSLRAARGSVCEGKLKMSSFIWVDLHTPSPTSRSRIQGWHCASAQIEEDTCVWVSAFANIHKQSMYTEHTSTLYDLHLPVCWFVCLCVQWGGANRACWRCTAARWLWWGEPLCSATPPAAAGCSAWGSVPRPAAPLCPLSPERHRHTTQTKAVAQIAVAGTGEERQVQRWL